MLARPTVTQDLEKYPLKQGVDEMFCVHVYVRTCCLLHSEYIKCLVLPCVEQQIIQYTSIALYSYYIFYVCHQNVLMVVPPKFNITNKIIK